MRRLLIFINKFLNWIEIYIFRHTILIISWYKGVFLIEELKLSNIFFTCVVWIYK